METLERLLVEVVEKMRSRFYGKYRGIVSDVDDSENLGRIRARVPEVLQDQDSPWALPCSPFAGDGHGLVLLPEVGDGVWIEFEAGDPARPIWTGAWWGKSDGVAELEDRKARALVTSKGHKLVLDDDGDAILLEHSGGAKVELSGSDITIESGAGKIVLSSSGVNVNNGALTVR